MLNSINSEAEYQKMLERVAELMQQDFEVGSDDYNELLKLAILVDDYETKNFPIEPPQIP